MKKMKIGVMVDLLLIGGVQKAAIEQVRGLNSMGHEAKLLILMRKKYSNDFSYMLDGIPHQYLSDSYPSLFKITHKLPIFTFLSTLHLLSPILSLKVIKQKDYNLLIVWGTTTCLTSNLLLKFRKIPYIAVIHDPTAYILDKVYAKTSLRFVFPLLKSIVRKVEGTCVKDALKTVVISHVHYDFISQNYNIEPAIVPLGIKLPASVPKHRGDTILSFGRWQRAKNPLFLLKLAQKLPSRKFVIAGSWMEESEYNWFKNKIVEYKLEDRVKVIPHYTDNELGSLCKDARLWVHAHFEAFGLAALEAASFGLPIIFPAASGMTEKFENRVHGFFPSEITVKEYKKYIDILFANKSLAEEMGLKAREVIRHEFSWRARIQDLLKYVN